MFAKRSEPCACLLWMSSAEDDNLSEAGRRAGSWVFNDTFSTFVSDLSSNVSCVINVKSLIESSSVSCRPVSLDFSFKISGWLDELSGSECSETVTRLVVFFRLQRKKQRHRIKRISNILNCAQGGDIQEKSLRGQSFFTQGNTDSSLYSVKSA